MTVLLIICAVLLSITSLLLILFTLMQEERAGMGSLFGDLGGSTANVRGEDKNTIFKRYTKYLGIVFGVLLVVANIAIYAFK